MEKISFSTFDFFSYAFPGVCILASFYLLDPAFQEAGDVMIKADQLGIGAGVALLVLGYLMGFSLTPIGRALYKSLGYRLWDHDFNNFDGLTVSEKYALIRELTPSNFKYIETWNVLCAMAHNLAIACLFVIVNASIKLFWADSPILWIGLILGSAGLFFLFLNRAVVFDNWAAIDINASVKMLELQKQAAKLGEKEKE